MMQTIVSAYMILVTFSKPLETAWILYWVKCFEILVKKIMQKQVAIIITAMIVILKSSKCRQHSLEISPKPLSFCKITFKKTFSTDHVLFPQCSVLSPPFYLITWKALCTQFNNHQSDLLKHQTSLSALFPQGVNLEINMLS